MSRFDDFWLQAKTLKLSPEQKAEAIRGLEMYTKQRRDVRNEDEGCLESVMDKNLTPVWTSAKTPLLARDRKDAVRANLQAYMRRDPAPSFVSAFTWRLKMLTASIAAAFSVGSFGLCYAADATIPGDALYPVKIHVNELLFAALSVTPEARAAWEVHQTERRLSEEQALVDEGITEGPLITGVRARVAVRLEKAAERLHEFAIAHPDKAAALEARLALAIARREKAGKPIRQRLNIQNPVLRMPKDSSSSEVSSEERFVENNPTVRLRPAIRKVLEEKSESRPGLRKLLERRQKQIRR